MEYIYKIAETKDWLEKLIHRNECGVVVGLPGSGVSRTLGESEQKLKLPVKFLQALDLRIYLINGVADQLAIDDQICDWIDDGVKYVLIQFIERSDYLEEDKIIRLLHQIRERFYKKINFLVHIKSDFYFDFLKKTKEITNYWWDESIYISYANWGSDFDHLIEQNCKRYEIDIKGIDKGELYSLCGGCPMLLKFLFKEYVEHGSLVVSNEIREVGEKIWSDFRLNVVDSIKTGNVFREDNKVSLYKKLGLLDDEKEIKSKILKDSLKNFNYQLIPKVRGEELYVEDKRMTDKFNHLEMGVIKKIIGDRRINRDEIAQMFYGKDRMDEVSEYSIDKLMSNIRLKLANYGVNKDFIKTLKGYGYAT